MAYAATSSREHAHDLIDRMAPGQLTAVVGLLEMILDPVARSLANAPFEDEEIDDEEERAVAESKAWLAANPGLGTSHQEVLAEFGFSAEDAKHISRTSSEPNTSR